MDEKINEHIPVYYFLEDYILETHAYNPTQVYDQFNDSFTDMLQELDFASAIWSLTFDEAQQRIAVSSYYYLKTFLYENTGNGLNIIPENGSDLCCYPNPFNPETTISFELPEDCGNADIEIYNVKGQCIRTFKIHNSKLLVSSGMGKMILEKELEVGCISVILWLKVKLRQ